MISLLAVELVGHYGFFLGCLLYSMNCRCVLPVNGGWECGAGSRCIEGSTWGLLVSRGGRCIG